MSVRTPSRGMVMGVALLAIAWSAWRLMQSAPGQALPEDQARYFDLVEQQGFRAAALQIPPVRSPWGNPSPRVYYFSCGDCAERFPGFFMQFNPVTKAALEADPESWPEALGESYEGRMYSADGHTWVEAPSVDGSGVTAALAERCPGTLRVCR